jgi:hypothetical protein
MPKTNTTLWCLLLLACAPNPQAPVSVMVLAPNPQGGAYETRQQTLTSVASLVNLKGAVVELLGGARVEINPNDPEVTGLPATATPEQLISAFLKNKGGDVRGNFIERSRVFWPADFHTWNMATTFWNFEQAYAYWQGVYNGAPTDALLGAKVLYFGSYVDPSTGNDELKDNALWLPQVRAVLVAPFATFQKIPLSINLGVIGHEYAHRVFNLEAYAGQLLPDPLISWQDKGLAFNLLKAVDEGIADFHGFGVTCLSDWGCRSSFLDVSIDSPSYVALRNLADPGKCLSADLRTAAMTQSSAKWVGESNHYKLGTILAASLYQASEPVGKRGVLQKSLLLSYNDDRAQSPGFRQVFSTLSDTPQNFTLEKVAEVLLSHVTDPDLQRRLCNELLDRLSLVCGEPVAGRSCAAVPSCPNTSVRGSQCPDLNAP